MNHRKAPLPASMKRHPAIKGTCRWCDQPILDTKGQPTKGTWHTECVTAFKLIHWPAETRAAVLARDKGICARCQQDAERVRRRWVRTMRYCKQEFMSRDFYLPRQQERHRERLRAAASKRLLTLGKGWANGAWQHDHIRPLVEANGDLSFWQLANIQTLCSACHVEKGREDNARLKREGKIKPRNTAKARRETFFAQLDLLTPRTEPPGVTL